MNIHDAAYTLANAIKESDEYKNLMSLKESINNNSKNNEMIDNFHKKQLELQSKQMTGENTDAIMKEVQNLYGVLSLNPEVSKYLQAEYALSVLISDVYKIIGEPLEALKPNK